MKGDGTSLCVAAASIIAKVSRDKFMLLCAQKYPQYKFEEHKGYGTKSHTDLIEKYGPCPLHRKTFEPIYSKLMLSFISEQFNIGLVEGVFRQRLLICTIKEALEKRGFKITEY